MRRRWDGEALQRHTAVAAVSERLDAYRTTTASSQEEKSTTPAPARTR
ncbi:hypothetical protein [Streptomyces sp. NPDC090445]